MTRKKVTYKSAGGRRARFSTYNRLAFGAICEFEPLRQTKETLGKGNAVNQKQSTAIEATKALLKTMKIENISPQKLNAYIESYRDGQPIPQGIEDLIMEKKHNDFANMFAWRSNPPDSLDRKNILLAAQKRIKRSRAYKGAPPSVFYLENCWAEFRKFAKKIQGKHI
ncbi:MAG: hypothetical protein ISP38_07985 [PS1 clade bacterium]|nr:hypothetical protein [PS1 clade bacterium]